MEIQKLEEAEKVYTRILILREQLSKWKKAEQVVTIQLKSETYPYYEKADESFIDFEELKTSVISTIEMELKEKEQEFKQL